MTFALRMCWVCLIGLVAASDDLSPALLAGAVLLYQPVSQLVPSAPLLSSLPARKRDRVLSERRQLSDWWWLGMGFSTGLFLASMSLWLASLPRSTPWAFGLLTSAVADVRVETDHSGFHSIVMTGDRSPAGIDASGVGARQAFERADAILAVADIKPADWFEARFWLSSGLAGAHDRESLAWAFVQMGSSHIYGPGPPDFAAARRFWQMAGLLGDRVALCFDARVSQAGLADMEILQRPRRTDGPPGCGLHPVTVP